MMEYTGIALQQPATRRQSVRHVDELGRVHLAESAKHVVTQDLCMQLRDSVDRMGADDSQIGHPHMLVGVGREDGQVLHDSDDPRIRCKELLHAIHEVPVDVEDDIGDATWNASSSATMAARRT